MDTGSTSTRIKNHCSNFLLKFEHEWKKTTAKTAIDFMTTLINLNERADEEMADDSEHAGQYDSLNGAGYLTDTVIDDYGWLLQARSDQNIPNLPRIFIFPTHGKIYSTFEAAAVARGLKRDRRTKTTESPSGEEDAEAAGRD